MTWREFREWLNWRGVIIIVIVIFNWLFVLSVSAQTNQYKAKPEDFRIVDGKLYNVVLSTNFVTLNNQARKTSGVDFYLKVIQAGNGETVMQNCRYNTKEGETCGSVILIKHLPEDRSVRTGDSFDREIRVMPVGTHQWRSTRGILTIQAYDYGLPNKP